MKKTLLIVSIVAGLGLSGAGTAAELVQNQTAEGISWAVDGAWGGATLKVMDGESLVHRQTFAAGEELAFSFESLQKLGLADGSYSFELVVAPMLSQDDLVEMQVARELGTNDPQLVNLPKAMPVASGNFSIDMGRVIDPTVAEPTAKDQVILDDLIVDGSACIGVDCVNGESFGFDTIRLKENNLRIKFQDTSSSASFPSNDWQITANDSSNGGANKFSIDDIDGGRTPFTIEAASPTNALYVDSSGNVGFSKSNPVVNLHVVDGNTPTLRLEQDGSSGFASQTWDLAGNETNLFIRDVTNGSQLPFRIEPGADTNSLYIENDNDVGVGTNNPAAKLEVSTTNSEALRVTGNGTKFIRFESSDSNAVQLTLQTGNSTNRRILARNDAGDAQSQLQLNDAGGFRFIGETNNSGVCLEFRDSDDAGDTFCTFLNGAMTCAAGTCP